MRTAEISKIMWPLLGGLLLPAGWAAASLTVSSIGVPAVVNFDGTVSDVGNGKWQGKGFQSSPTDGQLDSDSWAVTGWSDGNLAFGQSRISGATDYTRGTLSDTPTSIASTTTGGMYAHEFLSGNRALWIQPNSGDFEPGTLTLKINNGTGVAVGAWDFSYLLYNLNDSNRGNTFNFSYSTTDTGDSSYTPVSALSFTSPGALVEPFAIESFMKSTQIPATVLAGGNLFVRWSSSLAIDGTGGRDEFGLDNITVTAAVPEPAAFLYCVLACGMAGLAARARRRVVRRRCRALPSA